MKRVFSAFLLLGVAAGVFCAAQTEPPRPRAIVIFFADDLGYHDTSAYGCDAVPCPNLNSLASQGLVFTDAHSSSSVCTPSRYSLLTGTYAWRRRGMGILPGDAKLILPLKGEQLTLPAMMQLAGYRTAAIGKWHLGLGRGKEPTDWNKVISPSPREVGFDESFIMAATGDRVPCVFIQNGRVVGLDPADPIRVNYEPDFRFPGEADAADLTEEQLNGVLKPWGRSADKQHDKTIIDGISRIGHMQGGKAALWKDQDIADRIDDAAVRFIRENAGKPIFLYFCTNDIHVPRDPNRRWRGASRLGIRGDVTVQMDGSLGVVRKALADAGYKPEETLLIFTSDNGPVIADGYLDGAPEDCAGHNPAAPFSGGKYTLREGGTRMPFIVHWPGVVQPGRSAALISQVDLARSLARLIGFDKIPEGSMDDSQDMLPALCGQDAKGRDELPEHANWGSLIALRVGNLKLTPTRQGSWQLYDLETDPGEENDIAGQRPEVVKDLKERIRRIKAANGGINQTLWSEK